MKINLKLKKYFTEPDHKYNCFTACLFQKKKILKSVLSGKKYITQDLTKDRMDSFIKTLTKISDSFINGYYPDNFYLRLYYNNKIIKNKKYKKLLNILKQNKKVQLIKYEVDDLFDPLIGSLVRFYTFFDDESTNIEYSISIDSENFLNNKFIRLFNDFRKTNKLIYGISTLYYIPDHNNDYQTDNDFFNFIMLIGNCIVVKKNKMFTREYWDKYFINMFEQNDLMYIFNYNTFRKFSLNSIGKTNIKNINSYSLFEYGTDEIWINFILKKILLLNNSKDMLDVCLPKTKYLFSNKIEVDYKIIYKIKLYFKYNNSINNNVFRYFIKDCKFLKIKSYNELIKYVDNLKYISKNNNKDSIKTLLLFYKNIKKNKYFNLIYMDNNIKYIINNYKYLYNKVEKYYISELFD